MKNRFILVVLLLAAVAFPSVSRAETALDYWAKDWSISELRVGFYSHDIATPKIFEHRTERGLDLNGEVLFYSPRFLHFMWSPRPTVGLTVNTNGDTSFGYIGLLFEHQFDCGLFAGFNGGFAVHTGLLDNNKFDENHELEKRLGSRILFRAAPEIGYRFSSGFGMSVLWEHLSDGQVLGGTDTNQGLDNIGVRLSYRFGS